MATPRLVKDINVGALGAFPSNLIEAGGRLFFLASSGSQAQGIVWSTDGTEEGTIPHPGAAPDLNTPDPKLIALGDSVFFAFGGPLESIDLWKIDHGVGSPQSIATILPKPRSGQFIAGDVGRLTVAGNFIYFTGNDGRTGGELWKSDGTASGTGLVVDLLQDQRGDVFSSSSPGGITALGSEVYFAANYADSDDIELWKSDGTASGTVLVADIDPGPSFSSRPRTLRAAGNFIFFTADDKRSASELWRTDGTALGTINLGDIFPGGEGSDPSGGVAVGNAYFFSATDGVTGHELWKSDGTPAGTTRVADINPHSVSDSSIQGPTNLIAVGDTLFFAANNGVSGKELWKSDGTEVGTMQVFDINPGSGGSYPHSMLAIGDTLYFSANDGSSAELWKTDGTAAGTIRVAHLGSAAAGSNPSNLTLVGDTLFFTADDGQHGSELFALDLEPAKRYLCFSGGGWNTHSLLAGLFAGALDVMEKRGSKPESALSDLMKNVDGIAAISGGSWFLSQLAYSKNFDEQFDSKADRNAYTKTGYNGTLVGALAAVLNRKLSPAMRALIKSAERIGVPNTALDEVAYAAKLADFMGQSDLDWRAFVEQLVYKPLGMLDELSDVNLEAPRQAWAQDKDLVIATAISTSDTVLHSRPAIIGDDRIYGHADPSLDGAQARPLGLRSLVSDAGGIIAVADDPAGGDLVLNYSNDKLLGPDDKQVRIDVRGGVPLSPNLSIIDATVASSSALAAVAQPDTFFSLIQQLSPALQQSIKLLTTSLRRLSPLASFRSGQRTELDIPSTASTEPDFDRLYRETSQAAEVRLMDGGYVDNAPAAYMLRQIQSEQGSSEPFDLTLFFNSSIDPITGVRMNVAESGRSLSSFRLPADLAQLFGRTAGEEPAPPGTLVDGPFPKLDNRMPSPQIFKEAAWRGEAEPEWQCLRGSLEIRYFDLDVTTVRNRQFGIIGGQSGHVRIFASNNADSFAAPIKEGMLNDYNINYQLGRRSIRDFGGAEYMLDALGVEQTTAVI